MPSWLVDHPTFLYMILGIAALACGVAWWQNRKGGYLIGTIVALVLLVAVALISTLVPSDEKNIRHAIAEMAAGVREQNLNKTFAHISDQFQFNNIGKKDFRHGCEEAMRSRNVEDVVLSQFDAAQFDAQRQKARIDFMVKPIGNFGEASIPYRCVADFVKEPDGKWRLLTFQIFNPFVDQHTPMHVPGF
jgi:hypothetical protein